MAGKIIADQIQSTTAGTVDTKYVVSGSAKAWASFNMVGTPSINNSLSVSSLTDLGQGLPQINLTNSFSTVYYTTSGTVVGSTESWSGTTLIANGNGNDANTTSYYRISCRDTYPTNSGVSRDYSKVSCVNIGDLA